MSKVDITDNALTSKDSEILRLLNQIASDMVKRSDVDEIVKGAVAEEHDRMVTYYEEKMKAMAAEYEAVIASLKKKDKGGKKGRNDVSESHPSFIRSLRVASFVMSINKES